MLRDKTREKKTKTFATHTTIFITKQGGNSLMAVALVISVTGHVAVTSLYSYLLPDPFCTPFACGRHLSSSQFFVWCVDPNLQFERIWAVSSLVWIGLLCICPLNLTTGHGNTKRCPQGCLALQTPSLPLLWSSSCSFPWLPGLISPALTIDSGS